MKEENTNKNNTITIVLVTLLIAGGGGFFGGMKYQESKMPNLPVNFEQMRGQRNAGSGGLNTARGEVIDVDDSSITVKLLDDSSKIVILTDSTMVNKSEESSKDDLSEGSEVFITGQTNSDGSITAQNIQIGTNIMRVPGQNSN